MDSVQPSRREFLRAGAAAAAVTAAVPLGAAGAEPEKAHAPFPRRKLGRTGVEITMLSQGAAPATDRHLNLMHEEGIRAIDSADCYEMGKHERAVGEWLNKSGHRKDYLLVTKEHPHTPQQWIDMLDRRLKNGRQDYYDFYFLHGLGIDEYPKDCVDWPKQKEWAKAAERIKKSGKARFVGLSSCCDPVGRRTEVLKSAARGGWVDAIMVAANPTLIRDDAEFNKALDECHKAGIGLISMKEMRGRGGITGVFPEFEARGLSPFTAVLTAMWTDERFAAICSHMDNIVKLKENATAARGFKPMNQTELTAVHRMLDGCSTGYCIGCDGSCRKAAGTQTAFNDIARCLCYYEENGDRTRARRLYAALPPEARAWAKADLEAASKACVSKLDFENILTRAAEKLA
ncbi:MAG: aldo/keto reductase [bacterium]|nr:aldo/keto reductase [bacterium]